MSDRDVVDQLREGVDRAVDTLAGTQRKRAYWRMAAAVTAVAVVFVALTAVAYLGWGLWAGVAFAAAVIAGASAGPLTILGVRELLPNIVAVGLAVAAQIAFGRAALVRREDGEYEWTVLREDADGLFARLKSGRRVPIDGDDGDLFAFGFGQLAVTEEHGSNVDAYREDHNPVETDAAYDTRAGVTVKQPRKEGDNSILVSLAKIQRRVRGSASSMLVRRGRDKALDEEGGTGQLSQLWTMVFATVLLVVAYGMTIGVLML